MNRTSEETIRNLSPEKLKKLIEYRKKWKEWDKSPKAKAREAWRKDQWEALKETSMRPEEIAEEIMKF